MPHRRAKALVAGAALAVFALACTKEIEKPNNYAETPTSKPPSAGGSTEGGFPDSSKGSDGGLDGGEGGVCNELEVTGSPVDKIALASDPPAATGGTVVDGIYDLDDYVQYVGISGVVQPLGITARITLQIDGVTRTIAKASEVTSTGVPATLALTSSAYSTAGSAFATTSLCPIGEAKTWQYTSNSLNQIVLTDTSTREAFTFLKRP